MKLLNILALLVPAVVAIWPQPMNYTNGTTVLWFNRDTVVTFNGTNVNTTLDGTGINNFPGFVSVQELALSIISSAVKRTFNTIFTENFVPLDFHANIGLFEPFNNESTSTNKIQQIDISTSSLDTDKVFKPLDGEADESYKLNVTIDGHVTITAVSTIGVLRALDTFTQLFYTHSTSSSAIYTNLAPVGIVDKPMFSHRGLNLDVARSWFPVSDILRTIDALAWNKFSRLHIHATDSQSWPVQILELNQLTGLGPYDPNKIYTNADLKLIQQYGQYRGVEIYLEVDMPGHTASIAKAYPGLIACYNQPDWQNYASEPPSGQLKLNDTGVPFILQVMFNDLLPQLWTYSSYFHMGGDEINANCYMLDSEIKSNDTSVLRPLLQNFFDHNLNLVQNKQLTPIVWEEMLIDWNLRLPSNVVVQTWRNDSSVKSVVSAGHKVIVGNFNYWYLDCGKGQWLNFDANAVAAYWPFNDYCSPTKNWRLMYSYDPLQGLTDQESNLVIGGEVSLWSELTDSQNLDTTLWPRASAAGEILWSGAKDPATGQNRTTINAGPRLAELRSRLIARGVRAEPVQMIFCTQGNGTTCSLHSLGGGGSGTSNQTFAVQGVNGNGLSGGGAVPAAGGGAVAGGIV